MTKKEMPEQMSVTLRQAFDRLVHHDHLTALVGDVHPDPWVLWLLYTALCEKMPKERAQGVTLAAVCVQAGGDIHEQVSLQDALSDDEKRKQQLYVLAGDYYSTLYYQALAEVTAFDMIALYGQTLQGIYERKMTSYINPAASFDARLTEVREIRALLPKAILKKTGQTRYEALFADYILLVAMMKEESMATLGAATPLRLALQKEAFTSNEKQVKWCEAKKTLCTRLRTHVTAWPTFAPAIMAVLARCKEGFRW